jgi:SAM-dependent methyltransferase
VANANSEQAEFWAGIAPTWVEIEDELEQISGEPGRMAMDRLDLQPGQHLVDLGCGTGRTTIEMARRVAPGGQAVGVDIAEPMLVRARQHAADAGADNVEFVQADVQSHDLGDGTFDAAYSRFGVMFYTHPVAAFTAVRKAIRPGGHLSFVCWQPLAANDWMFVPGMAAVSVLGVMPPMPAPGEPGPFSLSDPDRVESTLRSAGFSDIDIQPHSDFLSAPAERLPHLAELATRTGAVRELLKDRDPATRARVVTAIEQALRGRVESGEVHVSRGILIVVATA